MMISFSVVYEICSDKIRDKLHNLFSSYVKIRTGFSKCFKMIFYMVGLLNPSLRYKIQNFIGNSLFVDFWHVLWAISPSVPCQLIAHFEWTGLISVVKLSCKWDVLPTHMANRKSSWQVHHWNYSSIVPLIKYNTASRTNEKYFINFPCQINLALKWWHIN